MPLNLRHTQTNVNLLFACHAMEEICAPCNITPMKIRLGKIRKLKGLRLEDIAAHARVATSTVSRWEAGGIKITSERLKAIVEAYDCRVSDVFDDSDSGREPLFPERPVPQPTTEQLEKMIGIAMMELEPGAKLGDFPHVVASSLHAQLERYRAAGGLIDNSGGGSAPDISAPPHPPTKPGAPAKSRRT